MATTNDGSSEGSREVATSLPAATTTATRPGQLTAHEPDVPAEQAASLNKPVAASPTPPAALRPAHSRRRRLILAGIVTGAAVAGYVLVPLILTALNTVSTDDAYVNGHVTFVAPRVAGHVTTVLVDDNQRVRRGDILVQLDKEPYQVQVNISTSALLAAKRELATALAKATRSGRPSPQQPLQARSRNGRRAKSDRTAEIQRRATQGRGSEFSAR